MKVTKRCSECGGREIYTKEGHVGGHTTGLLPDINIGGVLVTHAKVEIYVCGQCGHYQLFLEEKTLEKVKEKYKRYE